MNNSEQPVIAVIGLGLLGASLGMALRGGAYRRSGWTRRPNIRRWALDCDVLDETCDDIESVLNRADLTLIALPIPEILHYLKQYAHAWRPGTVVTDLGSVKSCVMEAAAEHLAP
ncbi:MAG: prephenate dehydrogenase/arogenate dehydrogenase family protein, partial [Victivallis vadensis]